MTTSIPRLPQSTSLHMHPSNVESGHLQNNLHPTEPELKSSIVYYVETDNRHFSSSEGHNLAARNKRPVPEVDNRHDSGKIMFKILFLSRSNLKTSIK